MKKSFIAVILLLIALLAACSSNTAPTDEVWDEFNKALAIHDRLIILRSDMLSALQTYIDEPAEYNLNSAFAKLDDIASKVDEIEPPSNTPDTDKVRTAGFDAVDYNDAVYRAIPSDIADLLSSIGMFKEQLDMASEYEDTILFDCLKVTVKAHTTYSVNMAQIHYLGINSIFLPLSSGQADNCRSWVLPNLESYKTFALPWETEESAILSKANLLFDEAEYALTEMYEQLGKMENELINSSRKW